MTAIWLASWLGPAVTGQVGYNAEQLDKQQGALSWMGYLGSSDFWARTLQNWQSEFLAVGSMGVLDVYLRQRGSPESKPVGGPHDATGVEGCPLPTASETQAVRSCNSRSTACLVGTLPSSPLLTALTSIAESS